MSVPKLKNAGHSREREDESETVDLHVPNGAHSLHPEAGIPNLVAESMLETTGKLRHKTTGNKGRRNNGI